ncbi:PREDICTED: GATA zinc finger domain-containing protein 14-like, partial [Rhagoletis zephyria]|uniref:GATA zinc finger domain-containing protein 14-like n=1 Tax=Rhagoletis zephyria TaxID=28612 RepID=UPI00081193D4
MINNNLDYERNSNIAPAGVADSTATARASPPATISPTTANRNNQNSNTNTNTNNSNQHTSIDNGSYFNRFDNRIAANLAAVLTGARFRSSSTSSTSSSPAKTLQRAKNANNLANTPNSSTNMNTVGKAIGNHYNGVSTLGGVRKPPTYLPLRHGVVGDSPRPSSPMLNGSVGRNRRPMHLFTQANLNCNDNEKAVQHTPPSSDEDNSPTELNNCKRLADKPPL